MVEMLRHMFGCCGEGHPSILYLLGITPALWFIKGYIISFWFKTKTIVKNCLGWPN